MLHFALYLHNKEQNHNSTWRPYRWHFSGYSAEYWLVSHRTHRLACALWQQHAKDHGLLRIHRFIERARNSKL